ncbi:hypothetical protein HO133_010055 [Letharia lupina]|uniref:Phosphoribulokinase/uridine kinase domain-containing protein n=1 Tax=Letharia lupina TaxID=560253 RepID=A0A8H6CKF3_9LECA|nr:uncharacterized protein HO133_010055 [Letharia lupina]KAF6224861.1 hypothetical protein HO133_010055 [Letharia lupina]
MSEKSSVTDDIPRSPIFIGVNGPQGSGKTTLVSTLAEKLRQPPHSYSTIVLSIDDLYLTHEQQSELAASHPSNPLIQHRGQPSTHDLPLALYLFSDLQQGKVTKIPSYDKSAYSGQGDRVPKEEWPEVNRDKTHKTEVVLFEGWCVGFRALPRDNLVQDWEGAVREREKGHYVGRLGWNRLEDVDFVNEALRRYDQLTDQLDALIHLDAEDPIFVYDWRSQSERKLREKKGSGMTDEQVVDFVNGYYPAYELFTTRLRAGAFDEGKGRQLRLVIGRDRRVREVVRL